jgi:hypothetical protein
MEADMFEENGTREVNGGESFSIAGIIGAGVLLLATLGALIYFFLVQAP